MKTTKLAVAAIVAAALSSPLYAADTGFSLSLSAGQAELDTGISSTPDYSVDDTDTTWSITLGYRLNQFFAIEGGYRDLGEASITTLNTIEGNIYGYDVSLDEGAKLAAEADGYTLGIVGTLPLGESFDLYAKAGIMWWDVTATASGSGDIDGEPFDGSVSGSDDGSDPYYGIGAQYNFNEQVSLGVQYLRFDVLDSDIDVYEANLTLNF